MKALCVLLICLQMIEIGWVIYDIIKEFRTFKYSEKLDNNQKIDIMTVMLNSIDFFLSLYVIKILAKYLKSTKTKLKNTFRLILLKSGFLRILTGALMWSADHESGELIVFLSVYIYCLMPMVFICIKKFLNK